MKKTIFMMIMFCLCAGCVNMTTVRPEDKNIFQVYDAPGYSKDILYEKTKIWIAQNFKSAKAVIEYESKTDGIIIGNGVTKYPCEGMACIAKGDWTVPFTIQIDIKDNRFRLSFTNIHVAWPASVDTLGAHPAKDFEMWQQGDYDVIKPILLNYGEDIKLNLAVTTKTNSW